jgi:S-adenosylmethionine:tRNA ribosyltransferase-isomerase
MIVDPSSGSLASRRVGDLPSFVRPGDLMVINDAATLPASLHGTTAEGEPIEARLLASPSSRGSPGAWRAVLFGAGDWRTRTEDRRPPPRVRAGDALRFGEGLGARVEAASPTSARLVTLSFDAPPDVFWPALYRAGAPVQYAHVEGPLALWHVQTPFGARPWASEMPSAARPLSWELVLALRAAGIVFAHVTHAAGLSATGDAALDATLPLRESYEVPRETAEAVTRTRARGGRVIAVGTSATRALESAAVDGTLAPSTSSGQTDLVLGPSHARRVTDALFTGMHEPGTSHHALLEAFAPRALLRRAHDAAAAEGYLGHEFGDSMLIAPGSWPRSHRFPHSKLAGDRIASRSRKL